VVNVEQRMRQVLVELALASVVPARALASVVTGSAPESRAPRGEHSPADRWRERFNAAHEHERAGVLHDAERELSHLRRRRFAVGTAHDGDELRERILRDGTGMVPRDVAFALRCTPTLVRRTRLAGGRDPEHGRPVELERFDAAALLAAGLSFRAVELVLGVSRSTLHDRSHPTP
jgi:hypothetical protein